MKICPPLGHGNIVNAINIIEDITGVAILLVRGSEGYDLTIKVTPTGWLTMDEAYFFLIAFLFGWEAHEDRSFIS